MSRVAGIWRKPGLGAAAGSAPGAMLALALLVCGCVFVALAGSALSLHTRTQALHQDLSALGTTAQAVQVSSDWSEFTNELEQSGGPQQNLTETQLAASTSQIGHGLAAIPLPLAPGRWAGLSTKLLTVASGAAPSAMAGAGAPPRLEVVYRNPLSTNARLVAGTYATTAVPAGAVAVAVTIKTAARFGLHPGSRLELRTPSGPVGLVVTAIITERGAASTFWADDITVGAPGFVAARPAPAGTPSFWAGGVLVDPGAFAAMQNAVGGSGLAMQWEYPLAVGGVNADQAQGLYDDLNRAAAVTPALTGDLSPAAGILTVSSPLAPELSAFLGTQAAIQTVLLLLFVSMIVVGAAVILVAATAIVVRRAGELTMLRARGGSLRQVAALMLRGTAIAVIPAALVGAGLAIALIPRTPGPALSASSVLGWSLAGIALLAALAGPPLIAAWRHRRPAPASNPARITTAETARSRRTRLRRPVAEVTACAACAAGLVLLHDQGLPAGGSIDWFLTVAPVLVAIPVVVIMLRLYPLVIHGLLRLSARRAGATGFVALAGAARTSLTGVLPAFALVLALSVATFAGMLSGAIARAESAASWQTTGSDVTIKTVQYASPVTPAEVQAMAAVHGVHHATAVWTTTWIGPAGQPLTVVAVDPAGYAAVTADTPFARIPPAEIGAASAGTLSPATAVPVLASPSAAAGLGSAVAQLTSLYGMGPIRVRVAGELSSTPAEPGGGTFIVMPLRNLPGPKGQPAPNMVLITGSGIDDAQLFAVVSKLMPTAATTFRSAVQAALAGSPLQHGAVLVVTLTIAAAVGFGLFILVLGLALGSADRELTLARLTVMGHERATGLVLAEAMPAVLAAVIAGAACAVVLPRLIGSALDLSGFTSTDIPVQLQPDLAAFALPAAALVLIAAVALAAEARALHRRGVTGMLRAH
jgi:putative ABC transport system permease protein